MPNRMELDLAFIKKTLKNRFYLFLFETNHADKLDDYYIKKKKSRLNNKVTTTQRIKMTKTRKLVLISCLWNCTFFSKTYWIYPIVM
jgi:hypothetical protein